jgi:hypothetical protein
MAATDRTPAPPSGTPAGARSTSGRRGRRAGTWPLVALIVWSLYVWSTRIRNAAGDDGLSSGSKAFSIVLSLTFVAFAVAAVVVAVRAWSRPLVRAEALVLRAFAAWTVAVWVVRIPMIAVADHSVGFKVVHAVLGIISIVLAVVVWRSTPAAGAVDESRPAVSAG